MAYASKCIALLVVMLPPFQKHIDKDSIRKFMALTEKIAFQIFSQREIGSRNLREITRSRILS